MKNFMLDTETLAVRPNAVMRCISIVAFEDEGDDTIETLLPRTLTVWLDAEEQFAMGRAIDDDTVKFWEKQSRLGGAATEQAARILNGWQGGDMSCRLAMEIFAAFIRDTGYNGKVYSRGSNFDFPIIESIHDMLGMPLPFKTWDATCSRSIIQYVCQGDRDTEANLVNGMKSNHCSDYDCAVEVMKLQAIHRILASE